MKKNDIYQSENEFFNKQNTKSKQSEKFIYKNIFLCPLNKNDCVNSMDIFDDIILYGTIMGNVYLCRVDENNLKQKKHQNKNDNIILNINNNKEESKNIYDTSKKEDENETSKIHCIRIKKKEKNMHIDNLSNFPHNKITYNSNSDNQNENEYNNDKETNKEKIDNDNNNNIIKDSNRNDKEESSSIIKKSNEYLNKNNKDLNNNINTNGNINEKDEDDNNISYPQVTSLIMNASENISCLTFDTKDNVIISIGDLEIIKLEKISTFNINDYKSKYDYTRVRNYLSEEDHIINCENCTCFLTSTNYLMINTCFDENNSPITMQQIPYKNKILNNLDIVNGNIEMFNFCVPFDFDGDKFLFLDYQTKNIRRICIYYTLSKIKPFSYKINNDFGHISHMKLLYNNRIFLCRKYNQCEIHKINDDFTLMEEWKHVGEEIIAVEIYITGTKISNGINDKDKNKDNDNDNEDGNNFINDMDKIESTRRNYNSDEKEIKIKNYSVSSNKNNRNKKNILIDYQKMNNSSLREMQISNKWNYKKKFKEKNYFNDISSSNNFEYKKREEIEIYKSKKSKSKNKDFNLNIFSDEQIDTEKKYVGNLLKIRANELIYNKQKINEIDTDNKFSIATLDINGNFNLYQNKKNQVLFNLYKIQGIDQKYKDEEFFSVGFPYFIIMNSIYFGISTDHGIFVITKCKD